MWLNVILAKVILSQCVHQSSLQICMCNLWGGGRGLPCHMPVCSCYLSCLQFAYLMIIADNCLPLPTHLGSQAKINTWLGKNICRSSFGMMVSVGGRLQDWLPLAGFPWKPPCYASYFLKAPPTFNCNSSPAHLLSISLGSDFAKENICEHQK